MGPAGQTEVGQSDGRRFVDNNTLTCECQDVADEGLHAGVCPFDIGEVLAVALLAGEFQPETGDAERVPEVVGDDTGELLELFVARLEASAVGPLFEFVREPADEHLDERPLHLGEPLVPGGTRRETDRAVELTVDHHPAADVRLQFEHLVGCVRCPAASTGVFDGEEAVVGGDRLPAVRLPERARLAGCSRSWFPTELVINCSPSSISLTNPYGTSRYKVPSSSSFPRFALNERSRVEAILHMSRRMSTTARSSSWRCSVIPWK